MKASGFVFSALLVFMTSVAAYSQSTPVVDQRQANQRQRVKEGVKSGELTRAETKKLAKDQRELRRKERRAKADGEVTAKERAKLQRKENRNSRAIRRQKNDDDKRRKAGS